MRRILSLLLVLVLLCGLLPVGVLALPENDTEIDFANSGTCGENLIWVLDSDGTLTISGIGNMYAEPYWNGYNDQIKSVMVEEGVTSIGSCAFYECYGLEKVSLPETLMSIGTNAFYCAGITEVAIPDNVAEIWEQAFDACRQLKKITLGENLEYIGIGAFRSTAITEITIPAGVAVIDYEAFGDCANLTEVTFLGDAPAMDHVFSGVTATVYYPAGNATWTADVMLLSFLPFYYHHSVYAYLGHAKAQHTVLNAIIYLFAVRRGIYAFYFFVANFYRHGSFVKRDYVLYNLYLVRALSRPRRIKQMQNAP